MFDRHYQAFFFLIALCLFKELSIASEPTSKSEFTAKLALSPNVLLGVLGVSPQSQLFVGF